MDKETFDKVINLAHKEEIEVKFQGQREYAHGSDDVFDNFNRLSKLLEVSRETVLLTYALKHLDGIMSYIKGHKSQREDVRGRIKDLRMYLLLLRGMIDEGDSQLLKRGEGLPHPEDCNILGNDTWTCLDCKTVMANKSTPCLCGRTFKP